MTTSKRPVSLTLALIALAICAVAPNLVAQPPSAPGDALDLFSDVVEVKVVNLEVVVTDKSGQLVSGLEPGDFKIIIDGQEQTIDYFSEVQEGEARASELDGPPGVDAGRSVGTNFLVYVDDNHTRKNERDRIVKGLIEDLDSLGPKDKMAVVVQSGTRLVTLSNWSNSRVDLRAALEELLDPKLFGGAFKSRLWTAQQTSLRRPVSTIDVTRAQASSVRTPYGSSLPSLSSGRFLGNPADLPNLGFASSPDLGFADFGPRSSELQRIDLELAMSGALSTLRGFDKPDGRKVMLMVNGRWPIGGFPQSRSNFNTLTELDVLEPLIETANLLGYTLYPVNGQGAESIWRNASYNTVARRTGGRALYSRKDVLSEAVSDTRSYYWLGFNPDLVGDNQRHTVRVEIARPGLTVRNRTSYVDLSRNAQLAMNTQGALLFGEQLDDKGLSIEFAAPRPVGLRKMEVAATVVIPLDAITSFKVRGEDQVQLEVRFAVIDESGSQATVPMIPLILRGDLRPGDIFEHTADLLLRRRPHEILVSVYDPASGETLLAKSRIAYRQ